MKKERPPRKGKESGLDAQGVGAVADFISHPVKTLTAKVSDSVRRLGGAVYELGHDIGQVFTAEGDYTRSGSDEEKPDKK